MNLNITGLAYVLLMAVTLLSSISHAVDKSTSLCAEILNRNGIVIKTAEENTEAYSSSLRSYSPEVTEEELKKLNSL